ncbi:hypothetical protein ACIQ34_09345 [Ureibacillus sp. NPDC094379]
MKLEDLKQQLSQKLEQNSKIKIVQMECWTIPVHTLQITYIPVIRSKMDILMKMLLISFQKGNFQHAEQLSDILLVEQLFIQDLMTKMQKTGLIEKEETHYQLTTKGLSQLSSGVFEEEQEPKTMELHYSPVHETFLYGDVEEVLDYEDFPEDSFRYVHQNEELQLSNERILKELRDNKANSESNEENQTQEIISSVEAIDELQINDVPCIEFIEYSIEKNLYSARIWNTVEESWDEILEQQINSKDRPTWKETFK